MRIPTRYSVPDPAPGTTRIKRVFAFIPTLVQSNWVWLETYDVLEAYIEYVYKVNIEDKEKAFKAGRWTEISKRLR